MDGWSFSALIPVAAIVWGIADTWGKHLRKMKEMDLKMMRKDNDISADLQIAIKSEFERIRTENAELRNRIAKLEYLNKKTGSLDAAQLTEIAKHIQATQAGS